MSAKPFHQGHFALVESAATRCDEVYVYVSLGDRRRPGEVPIMGMTMKKIWTNYLEGIMPHNVEVEYVNVPVRAVYEHLEEAEGEGSPATYVLFGDPVDVTKNFPLKRLARVSPTIVAEKRVMNVGVDRAKTLGISGTRMRAMLSKNDQQGFIENLPDPLSAQARREIWNLLRADIT